MVVKNTTLQQIGGQMKIDYASLGNTAGIIGAALVAKQKGRES
jgi:glucokinase